MDNFDTFTLGAVAVGLVTVFIIFCFKRSQRLLLRPWHAYKAEAEERRRLAELRAESKHEEEKARAAEDEHRREIRAIAARTLEDKVGHHVRVLRTLDQAQLLPIAGYVLTEEGGDWPEFRRTVARCVRNLTPHGPRLADAIRQMGDPDYRPVTDHLGLDLDILLARILDLARAELDDTEATPPGSELAAVLGRCAAVDGEREKARQEQIRRALGIDGEPQPTP